MFFFAFSGEIGSYYTNLDCSGTFFYAPEQTSIPICMPIVRAYATLCSTVYGPCPFKIGSISACSIVKTPYSCQYWCHYIICGRTLQNSRSDRTTKIRFRTAYRPVTIIVSISKCEVVIVLTSSLRTYMYTAWKNIFPTNERTNKRTNEKKRTILILILW